MVSALWGHRECHTKKLYQEVQHRVLSTSWRADSCSWCCMETDDSCDHQAWRGYTEHGKDAAGRPESLGWVTGDESTRSRVSFNSGEDHCFACHIVAGYYYQTSQPQVGVIDFGPWYNNNVSQYTWYSSTELSSTPLLHVSEMCRQSSMVGLVVHEEDYVWAILNPSCMLQTGPTYWCAKEWVCFVMGTGTFGDKGLPVTKWPLLSPFSDHRLLTVQWGSWVDRVHVGPHDLSLSVIFQNQKYKSV